MLCPTMSNEAQFRVNLDENLKEAVDSVLERQGTTQKEGITRLFKWFVALDRNTQALILGQVEGDGARALAMHVLKGFTGRRMVARRTIEDGPEITEHQSGPRRAPA